MERSWLSIGSNLGDPPKQMDAALAAISSIPETRLVSCSSYYRNKAIGIEGQPDFLNAVVAIDTSLEPELLLHHIHDIERARGRKRSGPRWGPRTLDIDIILFGRQTVRKPGIIIPHYDMHNRRFVLLPLVEISPHANLPDGRRVLELLKSTFPDELEKMSEPIFCCGGYRDNDGE